MESSRATLAANGIEGEVIVSNVYSDITGRFDMIISNPPFHDGTRIDATLVEPLIEAAYRILEPGGELLLVHNSHLRYRPLLKRRFAATREVSRDRTFTVLSAKK